MLEEDPDLMQRASALIEAHKEAVASANEGEEAVVDNTGEVADFLEQFAQGAPRRPKVFAYLVRWQILQHHRRGEPFLGFTWEQNKDRQSTANAKVGRCKGANRHG